MINRGRIRAAAKDDARAIARVRVDSWRATYAGIVPAPLLVAMDASIFADRLARRLDGHEHGVLVTESQEGDIEGFAIAGECVDDDAAGAGEVHAIYLAPDHRGLGLGAPLLEAACALLASSGFATVMLWVLTANGPARRFYERQGFQADGAARMLDFDGTPIEEIRYERAARRV